MKHLKFSILILSILFLASCSTSKDAKVEGEMTKEQAAKEVEAIDISNAEPYVREKLKTNDLYTQLNLSKKQKKEFIKLEQKFSSQREALKMEGLDAASMKMKLDTINLSEKKELMGVLDKAQAFIYESMLGDK